MNAEDFFTRAALISGSRARMQGSHVVVWRGGRQVRLKGIPSEHVEVAFQWLERASLGAPLHEHGLPAPWASQVIRALDAGGLVEQKSAGIDDRSGAAALSRIEQSLFALLERGAPLYRVDQSLNAETRHRWLLGNAIEYYFITLGAYDAVAPSVARLSGELQEVMANVVLEEYRHDKLMLRALTEYGLTEFDLQNVVPLPFTTAITNELCFLAYSDPLALLASLFVVEGGAGTGVRYLAWLEGMGASEAYVNSHREHVRININGQHGSISRRCFSLVPYISAEDEERVLSRVLMLYRLVARRSQQIASYYQDPGSPCPRHAAAVRSYLDRASH